VSFGDRLLNTIARSCNLELRRKNVLPDVNGFYAEVINQVLPFSLSSAERLYSLCRAVDQASSQKLSGAIVECGVYKGACMVAVAKTLLHRGDTTRDLYLYDTFEGMPEPGEYDSNIYGRSGKKLMKLFGANKRSAFMACASIDEVQERLRATGYPEEKLHFTKGRVEETIPHTVPDHIAVLRLDTDWYESTKHELEHLYPRLVSGGFLIIDDYGHWAGARKAVDEYFEQHNVTMFLHRVDYTCRMGIK